MSTRSLTQGPKNESHTVRQSMRSRHRGRKRSAPRMVPTRLRSSRHQTTTRSPRCTRPQTCLRKLRTQQNGVRCRDVCIRCSDHVGHAAHVLVAGLPVEYLHATATLDATLDSSTRLDSTRPICQVAALTGVHVLRRVSSRVVEYGPQLIRMRNRLYRCTTVLIRAVYDHWNLTALSRDTRSRDGRSASMTSDSTHCYPRLQFQGDWRTGKFEENHLSGADVTDSQEKAPPSPLLFNKKNDTTTTGLFRFLHRKMHRTFPIVCGNCTDSDHARSFYIIIPRTSKIKYFEMFKTQLFIRSPT